MTQISSVLKGAFCPRRLLGPTIAVLIDERNRSITWSAAYYVDRILKGAKPSAPHRAADDVRAGGPPNTPNALNMGLR